MRRPLSSSKKTSSQKNGLQPIRFNSADMVENNHPTDNQSRIAQSLKVLVGHPVQDLRLADLIGAAGLSRRGFYKAFRKNSGRSPGQVIKQIRIELAKRLLVECDLRLEEIAKHCGYRSVNTLWVAFRAETGLAPKKFQRQAWLNSYKTYQFCQDKFPWTTEVKKNGGCAH